MAGDRKKGKHWPDLAHPDPVAVTDRTGRLVASWRYGDAVLPDGKAVEFPVVGRDGSPVGGWRP